MKNKPLSGIRIVNTRAKAQAAGLTGLLRTRGAEVVEFPTIEIKPAAAGSALDRKILNLEKYEWLVFTSANSVAVFFRRLIALRHDTLALKRIRIASIGSQTTRALAGFNITASLTAKDAVGEGLVASLEKVGGWKKKKVLIPRAAKARDIVPDALEKWGADVTIVPVYTTVAPAAINRAVLGTIKKNGYDCITFTSSSTFENLVEIMGRKNFTLAAPSLKAASIGPATSATIRKAGIKPVAEAETHTVRGLVDAIELYFTNACREPPVPLHPPRQRKKESTR